MLRSVGAEIVAYDPTARKPYSAYSWISLGSSAEAACDGADVLVVLTEWNEFVHVDPTAVAKTMNRTLVVDGRNVLNREKWTQAGFTYRGVGR